MLEDLYADYWQRQRLRERAGEYRVPCLKWFHSEALNDTERKQFEAVRRAKRLLDFGAGDLRLKGKFIAAGFSGEYLTLDASREFAYDFHQLSDISGRFDAIVCLEVIEHLRLEAAYKLLDRLYDVLLPGGVLVLSTPNPLGVVPMWARDAGHVQQFPMHDLLTWFLLRKCHIDPFRVRLVPAKPTLLQSLRLFCQRVLCYLLIVDYADGLMIVARKPLDN